MRSPHVAQSVGLLCSPSLLLSLLLLPSWHVQGDAAREANVVVHRVCPATQKVLTNQSILISASLHHARALF